MVDILYHLKPIIISSSLSLFHAISCRPLMRTYIPSRISSNLSSFHLFLPFPVILIILSLFHLFSTYYYRNNITELYHLYIKFEYDYLALSFMNNLTTLTIGSILLLPHLYILNEGRNICESKKFPTILHFKLQEQNFIIY